jgi:hypothetical protein
MFFYIYYNKSFDDTIFKFWLNHYEILKIPYGVYVEPDDFALFMMSYSCTGKIIDYIPKNTIRLTEKDFLISYTVGEDETMILSYDIKEEDFQNIDIIGRLFYVPVPSKIMYTTFEIPDFIIYKHKNHTNFTKDGIFMKNNSNKDNTKIISNSIVCLNLTPSKVAYELEYYETNYIVNHCSINNKLPLFFRNMYVNVLKNVLVNKEKQYAIIWHSKCACTTITDIFSSVNKIQFDKLNSKISLSWTYNKYKYNCYLQNIDTISFVRNPYERFLSSYIDKHVCKNDEIYLTLDGYNQFTHTYKESIFDLCKFLLSGGVISEHYTLITNYNNHVPYYKKIQPNYIKIEDDLNKQLYDFLKKYHDDMDSASFDILNYYTNTIVYKQKQTKTNNYDPDLIKKLKHFTPSEWSEYLSKYNLHYKDILNNDPELKHMIYSLYEADFIKFKY